MPLSSCTHACLLLVVAYLTEVSMELSPFRWAVRSTSALAATRLTSGIAILRPRLLQANGGVSFTWDLSLMEIALPSAFATHATCHSSVGLLSRMRKDEPLMFHYIGALCAHFN